MSCLVCPDTHEEGHEPDGFHRYGFNPDDISIFPEGGVEILVRGNASVTWVNIGEGYNGDWDPEDADDANLLRFDVSYRRGREADWEVLDDGSWCSYATADTFPDSRRRMLEEILDNADLHFETDEFGNPNVESGDVLYQHKMLKDMAGIGSPGFPAVLAAIQGEQRDLAGGLSNI